MCCLNDDQRDMKQNQTRLRAEKRILIFRVLTVISLFATAILSSSFGYLLLFNSQNIFYENQYNSFVKSAYESISLDVDERISFGKYLSAYYGGYCPYPENWPNCWLPLQTFVGLTQPHEEALHMVLVTLMPIVHIHKVSSFESYAKNIYEQEKYSPATGMASGTFGIFARSPYPNTSSFFHDTSGQSLENSPYQLLVPFFQAKKRYYPMLLYNAHSSLSQITIIDEIITCYLTVPSLCDSSVTDFVDLVEGHQEVPTTGVYIAITPRHNLTQLVGFISYYIRWLDILTEKKFSILANLDLVIDTGTTTKTFRFHSNGVTLLGPVSSTYSSTTTTTTTTTTSDPSSFSSFSTNDKKGSGPDSGDYHDRRYDHMRRRYELSIAGSTKKYSLTFYPTQEFYDSYHTDTPLIVSIVSLLLVLIASMIFLTYDYFVNRESTEQARVLEAKQTYVRFISHVTKPLSPSPSISLLSSPLLSF
jgi:hypothetical protein